MNNFSDIQNLLDRYWEGETTLEEERALKAYFASGQVDERLHSVAPLFQALHEEQNVRYTQAKIVPMNPVMYTWQNLAVAASVALLLSAGLWWWTQGDTPEQQTIAQQPPVQTEQMTPQETPVLEENKTALTVEEKPSAPTKKSHIKRKKQPSAQPLDPETELAMEEIKAALALVSSKIRKGKEEAAKGAIHLENVDKVFKKKSEG